MIVRAEIAEQPAALAATLAAVREPVAAAAAEVARRRPRYAILAARGSSDNAARYAQHLLGRLCSLPAGLATPSLHTVYDAPPRYTDALVIGISQSGASPDIVAVLARAAADGAVTIAVTNDPESPMAQAAAHVLPLRTGVEASVAATKTYTASLGVLAALAAAIAADRGLELELDAMPDAIARQLRHADVDAAIAAGTTWQRLAVLGRGANYATAFEAALKVKELTGVPAEPASPADFMHGPIAIVDRGFPVLAVAASGPALPGMVEALDAARARGGRVVAIAEPASRVARDGDVLVELERVPEWLSPMVAVVPAQLLAVGLAERLGHDPDRPFGLSKVTRTT